MDFFGVIKVVNEKIPFDREEALFAYNPFMVNRAMSMGMDTVLYANELNQMSSLDKDMCFDFYLHALPKSRRFNKWQKKDEIEEELVQAVVDKYKVSQQMACNYLTMMSDEEKSLLTARGGVSGKSKNGSGRKSHSEKT